MKKLYEENNIKNIANAIRTKNGLTTKYKVSEMAAAIAAIPTNSAIETESKTVTLDLVAGDQTVSPTAGKLLNQVVITKPATLKAENIKKDVNIAGIVGTMVIPQEETKTITPSAEEQVITPSEGKLISEVIVKSAQEGDTNLIAANIVKDVSIYGVMGTYEPRLSLVIINSSLTATQRVTPQSYWNSNYYQGFNEVIVYPHTLNLEDKTAELNFESQTSVTIKKSEEYDALNTVTIQRDANLTGDNIKAGSSIFGIYGTYSDRQDTFEEILNTYYGGSGFYLSYNDQLTGMGETLALGTLTMGQEYLINIINSAGDNSPILNNIIEAESYCDLTTTSNTLTITQTSIPAETCNYNIEVRIISFPDPINISFTLAGGNS